MIIYGEQNIFESSAQVLENTINTVGVMGKGIAKQFKDLYPETIKEYRYFFKKIFKIEMLWIYKLIRDGFLIFQQK